MKHQPIRQPRPWEKFERLTGVSFPRQDLVEFVLPDLDRDIERGMFITIQLAKTHSNPLVSQMYVIAKDFYWRLAREIISARLGNAIALRRARIMASFPEAPEIGFGYTAKGRRGRGVGSGALNRFIVDRFLKYPGMVLACAEEPDALSLIDGVGLDRSSDAVATICKVQLIEFTQEQARILRFRQQCMRSVRVSNVWSRCKGRLVSEKAELPVTESGDPILLVPKGIVRSSPPVRVHHYGEFYDMRGDKRSLKERIMDENADSPDRLLRAMRKVFEEPWRFRPRREFRED